MKEEILSATTELLNQHGIQKTTFRKIGGELGISDGHVRYYYKTKSELLVTLLAQMDAEILANAPLIYQENSLAEGLKHSFMASFRVMNKYAFIFLESPKVIAKYPEFEKELNKVYQNRRIFFAELFNTFRTKGFFKRNSDTAQLDKCFDQLFILTNSWISFHHMLKRTQITDKDIAYYSDLVMMLFNPFIQTEKSA